MANSIATITRNLSRVVDYIFVQGSRTEILEQGGQYIDLNFKEAGWVKIYNILMDGLSDYYRANSVQSADPLVPGSALAGQFALPATGIREGAENYSRYAPEYNSVQRDGFARGSVQGGWELYRLAYYRAKQFVIDQMDDEETAGAIIGNLLAEFIRTKVIPEVDEVRFQRLVQAAAGVSRDDSVASATASLGNLVRERISYDELITNGGTASTSILAKFNKAFVWAKRHGIPDDDQVIFCSVDVWGLLLADPLLTRYFNVQEKTSESGLSFQVHTYMGRPIIDVSDDRFFTDPILGNNGYYGSATSVKINFIVASLRSIVPVVKLDYTKIWTPETQDDFIGYKVNFAIYHDAFIPKNKRISVYASIDEQANVIETRELSVAYSLNTDGSAIVVNDYVTLPQGILGSLVVAHAASDPFSIGSSAGVASATAVVLGSTEINKPAAGQSLWFALVSKGVVVAKSPAILTA